MTKEEWYHTRSRTGLQPQRRPPMGPLRGRGGYGPAGSHGWWKGALELETLEPG